MNLADLFTGPLLTDESSFEWGRSMRLLSSSKVCHSCNVPMIESPLAGKKGGQVWRCQQQVCAEDLKANHGSIGGPGHTVAIDGILIVAQHKSRAKVQPVAIPEMWLFGGIDINTKILIYHTAIGSIHKTQEIMTVASLPNNCNKLDDLPLKCFMQIVQRCDQATLQPIIVKYVAPGTTIFSNQWEAFDSLAPLGYMSYPSEQSTSSRATILNLLRRGKSSLRVLEGTMAKFFSSFLSEFLWRYHLESKHYFEEILAAIARNPKYSC